jgi:hypothetical protein
MRKSGISSTRPDSSCEEAANSGASEALRPRRARLGALPGRDGRPGRWRAEADGGARYSFANPDFSFRQFRSNLVARWDFKPGSSVYVVWSQGRTSQSDDARKRPVSFLRRVLALLTEITSKGLHGVPTRRQNLLSNAWNQVSAQQDLLLRAVEGTPDPDLQRVGLLGPQLDLKLAIFRSMRRNTATTKGVLDKLLRLLDWINRILGSFAKAVPGVEIVKEYKDTIEDTLKTHRGEE